MTPRGVKGRLVASLGTFQEPDPLGFWRRVSWMWKHLHPTTDRTEVLIVAASSSTSGVSSKCWHQAKLAYGRFHIPYLGSCSYWVWFRLLYCFLVKYGQCSLEPGSFCWSSRGRICFSYTMVWILYRTLYSRGTYHDRSLICRVGRAICACRRFCQFEGLAPQKFHPSCSSCHLIWS